jgi:hypothetical protein
MGMMCQGEGPRFSTFRASSARLAGTFCLHAPFRGVKHRREAGLVRVCEHARDPRVIELRLGEPGLSRRVVAGNGDEGRVRHGM